MFLGIAEKAVSPNRRAPFRSSAAVAGVEGLEPPTSGFGDRRSSQLSYTPSAEQAQARHNRPGRRKENAAGAMSRGRVQSVPFPSSPRAFSGRLSEPRRCPGGQRRDVRGPMGCAPAVNVHVAQTVNRRKSAHAMLTKGLLDEQFHGAGGGNRTLIASLEGWSSTIELHPRRQFCRRMVEGVGFEPT